MVAFRCAEKRMPSSLARLTCSARNASRALADMNVPSTTSPLRTFRPSLSTVVFPSSPVNSIVSTSAAGRVTDCSLARKSSAPMVATAVLESGVHSPIEWGKRLAYAFTAFGARRSELPSRSTGFTAEPLTES